MPTKGCGISCVKKVCRKERLAVLITVRGAGTLDYKIGLTGRLLNLATRELRFRYAISSQTQLNPTSLILLHFK